MDCAYRPPGQCRKEARALKEDFQQGEQAEGERNKGKEGLKSENECCWVMGKDVPGLKQCWSLSAPNSSALSIQFFLVTAGCQILPFCFHLLWPLMGKIRCPAWQTLQREVSGV